MEADVFSCGVILYALLSGGRYALTLQPALAPFMYLQARRRVPRNHEPDHLRYADLQTLIAAPKI
jgi:hypothetical protein